MYQIYVRDCINYTLGTVSKHALGLGFGLGLRLVFKNCISGCLSAVSHEVFVDWLQAFEAVLSRGASVLS